MVRQRQEFFYSGRYSHSYMEALPDFVKIAESYGHAGIRVEKSSDVEGALREALLMKDKTSRINNLIKLDKTSRINNLTKNMNPSLKNT